MLNTVADWSCELTAFQSISFSIIYGPNYVVPTILNTLSPASYSWATIISVCNKQSIYKCMYITCACTYGNMQGYVRFQEENGAKRALDGLSNKAEGGGSPQICGADTELRVLEGRRLVS